MVVAWSGLSYALRGAPAGIPRRVLIPNTWDARGNWSVVRVSTLVFCVETQLQRGTPCTVLGMLPQTLQEDEIACNVLALRVYSFVPSFH